MSVDERLRTEAKRLGNSTDGVDKDALLRRIKAKLRRPDQDSEHADSPRRQTAVAAVQWEDHGCLPPGDAPMPPLAEVKLHIRHALGSASCARRAAELFDLLGDHDAAVICWLYAADCGDADAVDYVEEILAPTPAWPAADTRQRVTELARVYA